MGFWLVLKLVTLNDLQPRNDRYFALFYQIRANYVTVVEVRPILSDNNVAQRIFLAIYDWWLQTCISPLVFPKNWPAPIFSLIKLYNSAWSSEQYLISCQCLTERLAAAVMINTCCVNRRVKNGIRYLASILTKPFRWGLAKLTSYSSSVISDRCSESTVSPYTE